MPQRPCAITLSACQEVGDPAQPLVQVATGPTHEEPAVKEGQGSSSAIGWGCRGPAHKQPAVMERPLVRGVFSQPLVERWSSGGEQGKKLIPGFSSGAFRFTLPWAYG